MKKQSSYSFEEYVFNSNNNSMMKFNKKKQPGSVSLKSKNSIIRESRQLAFQKLFENKAKFQPLYFELMTYKHRFMKNKLIMKSINKKSIQCHKNQISIKELTPKEIKEKIRRKILKFDPTNKYDSVHLDFKTHNTFFDPNRQNKTKFQHLIAINFNHLKKPHSQSYQQQLHIQSNGCTIIEPQKNCNNIHTTNDTQNNRNQTCTTALHKKHFRLTKPMYMHKKEIKPNVIQHEIQKQISQQFYTEQSIRFIEQSQADSINLKRRIFENFVVKDQIFGQAFTIVHTKNNNNKILYQHNSDIQMQIASLTKTMTCLLILLISEKLKIDLKEYEIKINEKASKLQGTSAKLTYSDVLSVHDLLYGLMLPSGNDAALALAQWGGKIIRMHCNKRINSTSPRNCKNNRSISEPSMKRSYLSLFIYHMNILAKGLKLSHTRFANVHGLMNKKNYSCSHDVMKLCLFAMKAKNFRDIVNTKQYKCIIKNKIFANQRCGVWYNTNKLLNIQGFCGVKTGITPSAGPCLASSFKITQDQHIFIVLLKTKSINYRFEQSKKLLIQIIKQLYCKSNKKIYLTSLQTIGTNIEITGQNEDENNFLPNEQQQNDQSCEIN